MKIKYRYGSPIKERLLVLEEPGRPLAFDADRGFVVEMSKRHSLASLTEPVKGKAPDKAAEEFRRLGRKVMASTIELADGKYMDRTGEVVELAIIGPRPLDRWNVAVSTTTELRMQVFSCSLLKALEDAGVPTKGTPCREFCLAAFQAAVDKCGLKVESTLEKSLAEDKVCEFCFRPS
jgi:hypothetical protein